MLNIATFAPAAMAFMLTAAPLAAQDTLRQPADTMETKIPDRSVAADPLVQAPPNRFPPPNIDTNKDGLNDAWDRDTDGRADMWDTNGDGQPDAFDNDGDGKPDKR